MPNPGIQLTLVGDVMLGRMVNDILREVSPEYPWGDTRSRFLESDWRACNLECAVSNRGTPWMRTQKAFHFRSDAKNVAVLQAAKIDAVSLANNHALDFEEDALFETVEILDRTGIRHTGAGPSLDTAIRPAMSEVKGIKIAMVAFTDNQPEWEAGTDRAGVFYLPIDATDARALLLFDTVRMTRKQADLLIVSAHWGPNWGYEPLAGHVRFGHLLIDAGADLIFGHSGHVFQGVEFYRGRPIIYCAGNFIDDYAIDEVERNDESFIFAIDVAEAGALRLKLAPTIIADCQARLARGGRARSIAGKMAPLCAKLGTPARWNEAEHILEINPPQRTRTTKNRRGG